MYLRVVLPLVSSSCISVQPALILLSSVNIAFSSIASPPTVFQKLSSLTQSDTMLAVSPSAFYRSFIAVSRQGLILLT